MGIFDGSINGHRPDFDLPFYPFSTVEREIENIMVVGGACQDGL